MTDECGAHDRGSANRRLLSSECSHCGYPTTGTTVPDSRGGGAGRTGAAYLIRTKGRKRTSLRERQTRNGSKTANSLHVDLWLVRSELRAPHARRSESKTTGTSASAIQGQGPAEVWSPGKDSYTRVADHNRRARHFCASHYTPDTRRPSRNGKCSDGYKKAG